MREKQWNDVIPTSQYVDFKLASETEPTSDMTPGEIAARRLMQDSPARFLEIRESLERAQWQKVEDYHKRLDEEEARERAKNQEAGIPTKDRPTDLGAEKVLDKLRELKERAEP